MNHGENLYAQVLLVPTVVLLAQVLLVPTVVLLAVEPVIAMCV